MTKKFNDFNDLIDSLENTINNSKKAEGNMSINIPFIQDNIQEFNNKYKTDFSIKSTENDYTEYFSDQYTHFISENLLNNKNTKEEFNNYFKNYAKID